VSLGPQTLREVRSQPRRVIRLECCNSDSHRRRTLQAIVLTATYCPTCGRQTRHGADLLRQMPQLQSTERTTLHRMPKRASYERNTIAAILWPTEQELKATTVLKLPIEEASAKIRTGPSLDDVFLPALDSLLSPQAKTLSCRSSRANSNLSRN
jgi:hypothetical protein